MSEIFSDGDISITTAVARFGSTSYPIRNIGAVSVEDDPSRLFGLGVLVLVVGAVMAWNSSNGGIGMLLGGLLLCAVGFWLSGEKLILRTSSGNEQAFSSRNKEQVRRVKAAIEEALVSAT